ncbi:MAG: GTP 3',8-cyclase MoaA [Gammaproteobacteria bacterium]
MSTNGSGERPDKLVDRFGRHVTYLRISVTDRCNFRCLYCMAEEMEFLPRAQVLTLEEMAEIGSAFVELGVTKIRITGGEPLVRHNVLWLYEHLGALPGLRELTTTTNGALLPKMAEPLYAAGLRRLNISLDSLDPERFQRISRNGKLQDVIDGIEAAKRAGFQRIKLNSVILKGLNDDEILPLVEFARSEGLDISFIEEMPLGEVDNHDRLGAYCSSDEVKAIIRQRYELVPSSESTGGPSRYYRIPGEALRVGFISPHSHNFCDECNRVRLTVEGRLLLCLGQEHSVDLRRVVRAHPGDRERLKQAIVDAMAIKPKGHEFDLKEQPIILRHMNVTGG